MRNKRSIAIWNGKKKTNYKTLTTLCQTHSPGNDPINYRRSDIRRLVSVYVSASI